MGTARLRLVRGRMNSGRGAHLAVPAERAGCTEPAGPRLVDVARRAAVAVGTASAVLAGKPVVAPATRDRVMAAVEDPGYVRGRPAGQLAAHRRRNGFATWLFQPAVTGRYPAKAPRLSRCRLIRSRAFRCADGARPRRPIRAGC
ncbi:LacI family DNA-binding transcriptional regulator [Paractinoplanes ovalisporus]|uniref:LacI family DNA-binding transcriptional regulator n=1 Tax=Paractinoplanes ovalisporus TaxID=2810368 RepID=UPI0027DB0346|nr:LacI family DNA-binding transcriptional regulator [Actinoplanes ovalisporus]